MQPSNGGYWRPNDADDSQAQPQTEVAAQPQSAENTQFTSAYDGYELTAPQQLQNQQAIPADEVEWEASEYIQHDKDAGWFIILLAAATTLFFIALLFSQWTFALLVVAMTASIIVYARRPPRILHYHMGPNDFAIEGREYSYKDFKAFGITKEGPLHMITLIPRKRFMPPVTMYFEEKDGEKIVDILGLHMPLEKIKPDMFDDLVRKLRF